MGRTRRIGLGLLLALGAGALLAGGQREALAEEAADGKKLFEVYCSSCHGMDGRGRTPVAERLREAPPDLTTIARRRGGWFPDSLIREIVDGRLVMHGAREMPVWGYSLSQEELTAITQYLEGIQDLPTRAAL